MGIRHCCETTTSCCRGSRVSSRGIRYGIRRNEGLTLCSRAHIRHDGVPSLVVNHNCSWWVKLVCKSRALRRLITRCRLLPARDARRCNELRLLLEEFQLWVGLRSGGFARLSPLPFLDRIVSVEYGSERVASTDHVLRHMLKTRERGRNPVHVVNCVCACAGVGIVRVGRWVRVQVGRNPGITPRRIRRLLWRPGPVVRPYEMVCEYGSTISQMSQSDFVHSSRIANVGVLIVANMRSPSRRRQQGT